MEYTSVISSPKIFRQWTAIALIAAALEKRVWVRTKGSNLYPNLYMVLVGPPGVGKSATLSQAERLLRSISDLHVAPSSVTTASMVDSLNVAVRKIIRPAATPNFVQFNSLQVIASELGVFLPAYDPSFMNTLTKLYDGELYEERRRTGKVNHLRIDNPQLNILGGTTPSYLNSFLPEGAWDQGFTSRTIFVFSGEPVYTPLFADDDDADHLEETYKAVAHDLKIIAGLFGKFNWDKDAATAISAWDKQGLSPVPEHGKLTHYNSRRLAHCLKLCMVASIARTNDLTITLEDYQLAQHWLLEAEALMPDIFSSMGGGAGDSRAIEDTWHYVYEQYAKSKKPIGEHRIVAFLANRVPSYMVTKIIDTMIRAQMLKLDVLNGTPAYRPGQKVSAE